MYALDARKHPPKEAKKRHTSSIADIALFSKMHAGLDTCPMAHACTKLARTKLARAPARALMHYANVSSWIPIVGDRLRQRLQRHSPASKVPTDVKLKDGHVDPCTKRLNAVRTKKLVPPAGTLAPDGRGQASPGMMRSIDCRSVRFI